MRSLLCPRPSSTWIERKSTQKGKRRLHFRFFAIMIHEIISWERRNKKSFFFRAASTKMADENISHRPPHVQCSFCEDCDLFRTMRVRVCECIYNDDAHGPPVFTQILFCCNYVNIVCSVLMNIMDRFGRSTTQSIVFWFGYPLSCSATFDLWLPLN